MARSRLVPVLALGALVALAAGAWWWQRGGGAGASPARAPAAASAPRGGGGGSVAVESAVVRSQPLAEDVSAVGSLRSRQGTVVRAEVSGRVTQINFRDGQRVRRGQLLVQLDDRLQQAQIQQAQAELSIARANHKRNSELVAQGFISQRGVDESAAAVKVAQAKAELARATAARLRVLAPFDGVAGLRNISVGDYLKEGSDIVNLEDMNAMYVDFRLPERLQSRVRPGQTARVQVEALPDRAFAAVVQAVDPQIDANGRSLSVRGCIDNRLLQLRPGMFARVGTRLGDDRQALMIPEEAIVSQGGRQTVIRLLRGAGAGDQAAWTTQRVDVDTGTRLGGQVEILRGLAEGERIVTAGQQRIQRDGSTVRLADAPAAPANGTPDGVASAAGAASAPAAARAGTAPLPWAPTAAGPGPCGAVAQR
ncbi:efflux RND transporter periplasmic adaptor subunit [Ottowia testudinis]|uniref:Efflux RND transporter periplasmic adaptor subunit n=1 Tax=Ottowia testudinis TaxID=2816950 RepID=A0A975CE67_9BURK|nr:efflux RND transporter periplasmic adaptor subunit [Ottowia testudinis]QTD44202.1 efflux RND transporter periplasmic adaptor subunit [Ottowia testudinis]